YAQFPDGNTLGKAHPLICASTHSINKKRIQAKMGWAEPGGSAHPSGRLDLVCPTQGGRMQSPRSVYIGGAVPSSKNGTHSWGDAHGSGSSVVSQNTAQQAVPLHASITE